MLSGCYGLLLLVAKVVNYVNNKEGRVPNGGRIYLTKVNKGGC